MYEPRCDEVETFEASCCNLYCVASPPAARKTLIPPQSDESLGVFLSSSQRTRRLLLPVPVVELV